MKKLLIIMIFCFYFNCFSQTIRAYGTLGIHLRGGFEKNSFINIGGGLEIKIVDNFRPELEATYYLGTLPDRNDLNPVNFNINAFLVRYVSAVNYSFSPKIMFDISPENEKRNVYLQIMPKFNLTDVTAKGTFFSLNKENTRFIETDSDKFNEQRKSFGIAIGIIMQPWEKSYDALAFNL